MPPSTGELYTPLQECDGPNSALSGFEESFGNFAEGFGNFAGQSGILTMTNDQFMRAIKGFKSPKILHRRKMV